MKKLLLIGFLLFAIIPYNSQALSSLNSSKEITIVTFSELKNILDQEKDKLLVVNFWATWCIPCVEEIPTFMKVNEKYKNIPNYKMILISLDRAKSIESVKKFIEKKAINTTVYILDDIKNMNIWIPAIDSSWTGAIPATVFYKNGDKIFFKEEQLEEKELDLMIKSNL